jgi:hypothetical protein
MKTAYLKRLDIGTETLGDFFCENFYCKSLELPWNDNKPLISCIPKGEYLVKWTLSPLFKKFTYEVQKVPKRSGIRIHKGNYASMKKTDVLGCILLGMGHVDINKDGIIDIMNSTITINKFEKFMAGEDFKLIIE